MATVLQKFVDADQWEAEDIVGRLGLIAHAAFLHAGFVPYGAQPTSGRLLKTAGDATSTFRSRWYTAPALVHREGAEAAVLMLCKAESGDFALLMFLTTDRDMLRTYHTYGQSLDAAAMVPMLSRRLIDTEPRVSRLCRLLAEGPCRNLLIELCRRNGLALTGFMSLPDDIIVEILKRIVRGKALAAAVCTCRLLRRLVVECDDTEMWKPLYERAINVHLPVFRETAKEHMVESSEGVLSWKERYLKYWNLIRELSLPRSTASAARGKDGEARRRKVALHDYYDRKRHTAAWWTHSPQWMARGACDDDGRRCKVPPGDDNRSSRKRHGDGAIHSPSSRYRWKHR
ncbi:unnamed protein product [Urochloa decumbens]|uniref:F-box domain-containing protein n=1 Tax=Urochloa decumbens TaxID=240449 RepID=A0ABC8YBT0_9POAL